MIFDNLVIHNVISLLVLPKFENVRDAYQLIILPPKKSQNKTKAPHPPNLLQHMKFFNLQVEWEGG